MRDGEPLSDEALERIKRRMEKIDKLPKPMRALIHEYGSECVQMLLKAGIEKPRHMEAIIRACRGVEISVLPICDAAGVLSEAGRRQARRASVPVREIGVDSVGSVA